MISRPTWPYSVCLGIGLTIGLVVPILPSGCCGECPDVDAAAPNYRIVTNRSDWVANSGHIAISETTILITYETNDGSAWEVEYVVTDAHP